MRRSLIAVAVIASVAIILWGGYIWSNPLRKRTFTANLVRSDKKPFAEVYATIEGVTSREFGNGQFARTYSITWKIKPESPEAEIAFRGPSKYEIAYARSTGLNATDIQVVIQYRTTTALLLDITRKSSAGEWFISYSDEKDVQRTNNGMANIHN
jgi:hypothetical protein